MKICRKVLLISAIKQNVCFLSYSLLADRHSRMRKFIKQNRVKKGKISRRSKNGGGGGREKYIGDKYET